MVVVRKPFDLRGGFLNDIMLLRIMTLDYLVAGPRSLGHEVHLPFTFDYSKVHQKYHAAPSPNDELVLYKGGPIGHHETGFLSNAFKSGRLDHLWDLKGIIENGSDEEIFKLINRHTSYYHFTPFLSATFNPEQAQVFAPPFPLVRYGIDATIYRLKIRADRAIIDPYDIGNCGESKEVLILGAIYPDEITAIKLTNDDHHSELLIENENGTLFVRDITDKKSKNRSVRDPQNWLEL